TYNDLVCCVCALGLTCIMLCGFFFFFSSRRRHTRSLRDWSSDVCSSDLPSQNPSRLVSKDFVKDNNRDSVTEFEKLSHVMWLMRSEERRVGKECRSGWAPYK